MRRDERKAMPVTSHTKKLSECCVPPHEMPSPHGTARGTLAARNAPQSRHVKRNEGVPQTTRPNCPKKRAETGEAMKKLRY